MGTFLRPSLTTVMTSPSTIGSAAARMLLTAIGGQDVADVSIDPARLIVRDSTGPARF
jgi:DNA-binding LacI/PurR family transcriptional regulator